MVEAAPILELKKLFLRYGSKFVVEDLSFSLARGEIFALLGPNGAGKTTTICAIAGLHTPASGLIERTEDDKILGLCPQELVIWDDLSCFEQLVFMARMQNLTRQRALVRADELLVSLGLVEQRRKLGKTLSGGMKRRLNIALALVHEPSLVILDEPQAGLDPQSRVLVRDFLRSLRGETTILLSTHDMEEADKLADRVAILDAGRLLVVDSPAALKTRKGGDEVVVTRKRSLEDVFIELTGRRLRE